MSLAPALGVARPRRRDREEDATARAAPWRGLRIIVPALLPLALLLVWEGVTAGGLVSSRTLPEPLKVLTAFVRLMRSGVLLHDLAVSALRAASGFLIGGAIGFALGLANGVSRTSALALDSSVQMVRNIPHLALIPLVILWFGIDEGAKLFLVALGVFFPVYLNTYHGIRNVDPALVEMGRVYGLTRWRLFTDIILPGALGAILVGVRYALGIMWLTLIVAETISASSGIGYMTMNAREFLQTDVVVLGILLYAALGKLSDMAARAAERRWLAWNPEYRGR